MAEFVLPDALKHWGADLHMKNYSSICMLVLLLLLQTASSRSKLGAQAATSVGTPAHVSKPIEGSSDKPLITIDGLCDNSVKGKSEAASCKTVITRSQFERVMDAAQPNMPTRGRREFAENYIDALVMAKKAEQMGLDKGTNYEEQMKLARIQILSQDLKRVIREKTSQISDKDVEDYYQTNIARFERAEVERIYIPKSQQKPSASEVKLTDPDGQQYSQDADQTMKTEADNLHTRAATGEPFTKLQADAYQAAGIKSAVPNTDLEIRRVSLPPSQILVMDLKPGEISPVFSDPNGYFIYRIKSKETLPLDQTREEIKAILRAQHLQEEMQKIQDSATSTVDEGYFIR